MEEESENQKSLIFSYLTLRKTIGLLGMAFPFMLSLGALIFYETGIQQSISSYYHTGVRDIFVGTLCVIGFFLFSYRGHELKDNIAGDLACLFALGVALFPTATDHAVSCCEECIGYIHLAFATLFFSTLIYFSLCLFTKTKEGVPPTRKKLHRNRVYKTCGYIMGVSILLIFVYYFLPDSISSRIERIDPVFWLESLAIFAFGISWLTKGEAILKDEE